MVGPSIYNNQYHLLPESCSSSKQCLNNKKKGTHKNLFLVKTERGLRDKVGFCFVYFCLCVCLLPSPFWLCGHVSTVHPHPEHLRAGWLAGALQTNVLFLRMHHSHGSFPRKCFWLSSYFYIGNIICFGWFD